MCGIAGFVDLKLTEGQKRELGMKMLGVIKHRGPENSSVWVNEKVCLGHNRLKIIDLSDEANQPFEYEGLQLIFNGEIYNYIEIRRELEKAGYAFHTQSDTEVICAAYKKWGEACVEQFIGMWAFALWDGANGKLFCSRDRFGIKPFYYTEINGGLYFASEYKALKEVPGFDNTTNTRQMQRGLIMAWAAYKNETYYQSVKILEPACNLIWQNGALSIKKYWDLNLQAPKAQMGFNEKKETFFNLFHESIALHARSDVQNGMCLSGGLDSSSIASIYSSLFPRSTIKSFSIYYEGATGVDERPFVREVVNKYPNIQPFYFSPAENDIAEHFHNAAYHADVPVFGSSYLSQYFLMKLAKSEGVTVVLDGQGSDEYLGGYLHSFYRLLAADFSSLHWGKAISTYLAHINRENYGAKKAFDIAAKSLVSVFSNEERIYNLEFHRGNRYFKQNTELHFEDKSSDRFDNFLYHLLLNTTLPTLLHFEDRNSMAFSLESRVPFLNHKLVEFAFSLAMEDKINTRAETKYILREALKPVLPQAIYERKDKKGFVTPGEILWLNGPLKFLLDIDYNALGFMNTDVVKGEIERYKAGDTSNGKMVWRIAATHYWLKHFA
ncbi:MAG TPA: asparagine synthase (glutamine-hydrolyzing) [Chitinophagales bacterium]|nr:asparagine synthase (glutamine-hydrolyzing) [Chitinophagales bacterium]